jgi:hypothetical protein
MYVMAQESKLQELLAMDTLLSQAHKRLPKGWDMIADDTSITIFAKEKYVTVKNYCDKISQDSIASLPRTETALLRFNYEKRWSKTKLAITREKNDSLNFLLGFLAQEMGISKFYDHEKSTRFNPVYTGVTKSDKEKIEKFYIRRNELKNQISQLPSYNTKHFSLFQKEQTAIQYKGTCIYPSNLPNEMNFVFIVLMDNCLNPLSE